LPVVPSYGGPDEYSLQQRQLTYQPTRGAWPTAAPRGLRPIGMQQPTFNVFGGGGVNNAYPLGPSMRNTPAGYSDILAAQRLWSSFLTGMNGGGFGQR
jgi:hypothetical protein